MEEKELLEQEEFTLEDIIREFSDHPVPPKEEPAEEEPSSAESPAEEPVEETEE